MKDIDGIMKPNLSLRITKKGNAQTIYDRKENSTVFFSVLWAFMFSYKELCLDSTRYGCVMLRF